jgi:hypothetical protein
MFAEVLGMATTSLSLQSLLVRPRRSRRQIRSAFFAFTVLPMGATLPLTGVSWSAPRRLVRPAAKPASVQAIKAVQTTPAAKRTREAGAGRCQGSRSRRRCGARPQPALLSAPSWWESAGVEVVAAGKGRINYEAGVVKATGLGALAPPSLSRSRAQDTLDARQAALADALRTLALAVGQVRVNANTRVRNYVLQDDEVRLRVDDVVKSAQVIEEALSSKTGVYRVVVQVPLSRSGSVSEAVGVGDAPAATVTTP